MGQDFTAYETEPRGLWGVIAQKAKSVIGDAKSNDSSSSTASQVFVSADFKYIHPFDHFDVIMVWSLFLVPVFR